jgi:hypothetical protein
MDGAVGAGARGQVDAADDSGRDPDGCLLQVPEDLKVEVATEDELYVGSTYHLGQLLGIPQPERPLHLDVQGDRRMVKGQDSAARRGSGQQLAQPVELSPAEPAVALARHERVQSDQPPATDRAR